MTQSGPPLEEGEEILFDHIPSHAAFRKVALILLAVTLLPTAAFAIVFPDTIWPAVPLFAACVILMQERVTFGRHRAWVTSRRIVMQKGRELPLTEVTQAAVKGNGVRVGTRTSIKGIKLFYPPDGPALAAAINAARTARQEAPE